jgi:ribosomal protein L37AE/L43A
MMTTDDGVTYYMENGVVTGRFTSASDDEDDEDESKWFQRWKGQSQKKKAPLELVPGTAHRCDICENGWTDEPNEEAGMWLCDECADFYAVGYNPSRRS